MNYKALSTAEKLAAIADCNFWGEEIALAGEYALAVADGNRSVIEDYESFGDSPRQFIMNKREYARAVSVFGFTEKRFNAHGWIDGFTFADCETVVFEVKAHVIGRNSITTGRSPNGKWTHGLDLAASKAGSGSGLSVFGDPYNSRRECLITVLKRLIAWHEKENDQRTAPVLKEAKNMLDELTGRKPVQLSLFTL
ncbi:MAG: hypothetical protein LBB60_00020 [Desulfovibrio sp.]|jgi:hypothetical protein|nr:hypothetical protein [Desulfovibrio sp.]